MNTDKLSVTPESIKDEKLAKRFLIFGNNVRLARKKMGFSSTDFARFLGISVAYVGLIERGERTPSVEMLIKICDFFGRSVDSMMASVGDKSSVKGSEKRPKKYMSRRQTTAVNMMTTFDKHELDFIISTMRSLKALGSDRRNEHDCTCPDE
ncbi:MAG: helix-turn-helix domain-containing protein [Defluviitaleaceae bacterium]|nr:helix-turn-helix domain-containing protein [Defluviitaleaceae bacterium]